MGFLQSSRLQFQNHRHPYTHFNFNKKSNINLSSFLCIDPIFPIAAISSHIYGGGGR